MARTRSTISTTGRSIRPGPTGLPCVIMLDLKMPRVDGLQVLHQIKSDPALRHIPVVMLTSSREEKDLVSSYDLGVNAFVVKPVDFDQFLQCDQGARHVLGDRERAATDQRGARLMLMSQ